MELIVKGSFERDIGDYTNRYLLEQVNDAINNIKGARSIEYIQNLKKLRDYKLFYRIRVADNYRIGLIIRKNIVWAVRFGHRSTIYKYFP